MSNDISYGPDDFDDEIVDLAKQAAALGEFINDLGSANHGNGEDIRREATLIFCASMICEEIRSLRSSRGTTRLDRLFGR